MKTVLFVDDSRNICELMELMCQLLPAVECICITSMSAVQERAAEVLRTSLAILDVNLEPGEPSRVDIYRWLKRKNYRGKIVFLSGHAKTDRRIEEAGRIPGVDFFQKPLGFYQIEALILGTHQ